MSEALVSRRRRLIRLATLLLAVGGLLVFGGGGTLAYAKVVDNDGGGGVSATIKDGCGWVLVTVNDYHEDAYVWAWLKGGDPKAGAKGRVTKGGDVTLILQVGAPTAEVVVDASPNSQGGAGLAVLANHSYRAQCPALGFKVRYEHDCGKLTTYVTGPSLPIRVEAVGKGSSSGASNGTPIVVGNLWAYNTDIKVYMTMLGAKLLIDTAKFTPPGGPPHVSSTCKPPKSPSPGGPPASPTPSASSPTTPPVTTTTHSPTPPHQDPPPTSPTTPSLPTSPTSPTSPTTPSPSPSCTPSHSTSPGATPSPSVCPSSPSPSPSESPTPSPTSSAPTTSPTTPSPTASTSSSTAAGGQAGGGSKGGQSGGGSLPVTGSPFALLAIFLGVGMLAWGAVLLMLINLRKTAPTPA